MDGFNNPALKAFIERVSPEFVLAQLIVRRRSSGFELRHVADSGRPEETLRLISIEDLRDLAQFTAEGAFRPLRSAPNLRPGWRSLATDAGSLERALNQVYPGALADWHAAQTFPVPTTSFREFAQRQTGMYRIIGMLEDPQAARVIRAGCAARFCLKQRLWPVEGVAPDRAEEKSAIPCLEPCALLAEFARKAMRLEQGEKIALEWGAEEAETLVAALEAALQSGVGTREGDVNSPGNPRRLQLALERIKEVLALVRRKTRA
jgi:hypothetical protein